MGTYLVLNLCFMTLIIVLLRLRPKKPSKSWLVTLAALLLLTALFDNIIIGLNIVAYNPGKILNLYVGSAPIEDFFYALMAAILIPTIWNKLGDPHVK